MEMWGKTRIEGMDGVVLIWSAAAKLPLWSRSDFGVRPRSCRFGHEVTLECDREAVAFAFKVCSLPSEIVVHTEGLKRQLRGRSPKRFAQGKRNTDKYPGH